MLNVILYALSLQCFALLEAAGVVESEREACEPTLGANSQNVSDMYDRMKQNSLGDDMENLEVFNEILKAKVKEIKNSRDTEKSFLSFSLAKALVNFEGVVARAMAKVQRGELSDKDLCEVCSEVEVMLISLEKQWQVTEFAQAPIGMASEYKSLCTALRAVVRDYDFYTAKPSLFFLGFQPYQQVLKAHNLLHSLTVTSSGIQAATGCVRQYFRQQRSGFVAALQGEGDKA